MGAEMKRRLQKMKKQSGLSLLEVLVGILVFSVGILGVVGLQARAIQLSVDAEDRTRAALLANEIVSTMWSQKTTSLPTATTAAWLARVQNVSVSGLPGATGTVTSDVNGLVTVSITWKSSSKRASGASNTYRTQTVMP
jgi:type IV pilus assembly protein PilV